MTDSIFLRIGSVTADGRRGERGKERRHRKLISSGKDSRLSFPMSGRNPLLGEPQLCCHANVRGHGFRHLIDIIARQIISLIRD